MFPGLIGEAPMSGKSTLGNNWDPLSAEVKMAEEIYASTLKREIKNIIKSYTGWFDPLSELIQNALDAIDERNKTEKDFAPKVWIEINMRDNFVCVTDNGIGFTEEQFSTFLRPNVSFKGGGTRGDKGVGATYLAYGFNYLQMGTKTSDFDYVGELKRGREWLEDDKNVVPRPKVILSSPIHKVFNEIDRGSTFCLKFIGKSIRPSSLAWFTAQTCEQWATILRIRTPLGGVYIDRPRPNTVCFLKVVKSDGTEEEKPIDTCDYLYPHKVISACVDVKEMVRKQIELTELGKSISRLPTNFYNLNGIYSTWNFGDPDCGKENLPLSIGKEDQLLLQGYGATIYAFFTYSTDVWDEFNDNKVGLGKGMRILRGGLQMASNGMPQGELILIPLTRNIGYQHTTHVVFHFSLADPDLGRKGFQPELEDLAERMSVLIVGFFQGWKTHLRKSTGAPPQISQDKDVHVWKTESEQHEKKSPLMIQRKDVFLPTNEVALTAAPQVEQDVVSLFNQLIAGGVIRGIKVMSASQHKKYDGLWRGYMKKPYENYLFDKAKNPLGIEAATPSEFESPPYVLEYKYSFDALLEEIEQGEKDQSTINLVICWEMGKTWKKRFSITPLLHFSNVHHRDIHGVTHLVQDSTTGQHVFRAVVLKELIDYINDPDAVQKYQEQTYLEE
jgi:hypothetical protein